MPLILVALLCLPVKLCAQALKLDGTDTAKIGKLIAEGKKFKLSSDGNALLKVADQLEEAGKNTNSKVGLLYASLYKSHVYWLFSKYTESMKYSLEALSRSKQWNIKNKLPEIYGDIGTLYKENREYPKAMAAITQAVQAARELNDTSALISSYKIQAMFTHGYAYNVKDSALAKKIHNQSLIMYLKGLQLAKSKERYEINRIGFYNNISQYYLEEKDYKKSMSYGDTAQQVGIKYKQYKSLTYTYTWLGEAYFQQGQRVKGIAYLQSAIKLCVDYKFAFREMEIYSGLEECYVQAGDYKNAWKAKSRWVNISDSLNIIKNVNHLNDLDVKYQTAEKNAQIRLLDQSGKQKNVLFIVVGVGLLIVIIFAVVLYYQKQQLNDYNQSLITSNKTINDQAVKLEILLKELHHRVKNNLQIVTSLLNLQSNRLTDEDAKHAIRDSRQRIDAMSLIHRTLYQQEDSSMVNMRQFISDLVMSIMQSFGVSSNDANLKLTIDVEEMDIDMALPLGLIINELVINSFKHAYNKNSEKLILSIDLNCSKDCELTVQDNGPGMPAEIWEKPQNSFGIKLVKLLTKQLGGTCVMDNNSGTKFTISVVNKLNIHSK